MRILLVLLLVIGGGLNIRSLSAQVPEEDRQPLLITLDQNNDFVITGIGQQLVGINFEGPEGSFGPAVGAPLTELTESGDFIGSAPDPFDFMLGNGTSKLVAYGSISPGVKVEGSYTLQFGPTDTAILDEIAIQIGFSGYGIPFPNPFNFVCDDCNYPTAVVTADGGIEVSNVNEPVIRLTVFSKDGVLKEITNLPVGVSVVSASPQEVTLENPTGFEIDALQNLGFLSGVSSSQNVFVEFGLQSGVSFGPLKMPHAVPEPATATPLLCGGLMLLGAVRRRRR